MPAGPVTGDKLSCDIAIPTVGQLQHLENCTLLGHMCHHALLALIARLQTAASLATPPHGSLGSCHKAGRIWLGNKRHIHYSQIS